jgi:hypothetical protein
MKSGFCISELSLFTYQIMAEQLDPLNQVAEAFGVVYPPDTPMEALRATLAERISHMAVYEPQSLLQLCYRLDIDEKKLSGLDPGKPALDMADLIIARQLQKAASRASHKADQKNGRVAGNEGW